MVACLRSRPWWVVLGRLLLLAEGWASVIPSPSEWRFWGLGLKWNDSEMNVKCHSSLGDIQCGMNRKTQETWALCDPSCVSTYDMPSIPSNNLILGELSNTRYCFTVTQPFWNNIVLDCHSGRILLVINIELLAKKVQYGPLIRFSFAFQLEWKRWMQ